MPIKVVSNMFVKTFNLDVLEKTKHLMVTMFRPVIMVITCNQAITDTVDQR